MIVQSGVMGSNVMMHFIYGVIVVEWMRSIRLIHISIKTCRGGLTHMYGTEHMALEKAGNGKTTLCIIIYNMWSNLTARKFDKQFQFLVKKISPAALKISIKQKRTNSNNITCDIHNKKEKNWNDKN